MQEARICAESVDQLDAEAAEITDIVSAFENKTIRLGGEEEKTSHVTPLKYVILHKVVEGAGCTVCPACLRETPVKYSICLLCKGMMVSHGRCPLEIKEEDDADDEEAMELDDDVEIKQEPTAEDEIEYKDAVDQGLQEAEAYSHFTFDGNEVDFGDKMM